MISYKNIFQAVCFLSNIFKGNLKPHLINEIDDQFVKKHIETNLLKKSNDLNKLEIYLKQLYGANKQIQITNSGRIALFYILNSLKLNKGSQILIPSYSCFGLIQPIISSGNIPKFIDINRELNPSFNSIKKSIDTNTKVLIYPYLGGNFSDDFFKIKELCKKKKIIFIEDCCQAFGLKIKNRDVGIFSDISFFSSGVGKPVFTPEGGWILVNNPKVLNSALPKLNIKNSDVYHLKEYKKFCKNFSNNYFKFSYNIIKDIIISMLQKNKTPFIKINDELNTISNLSAAIILQELRKNKSNINKRETIARYWKNKIKDEDIDLMMSELSIYNKFYVKSSLEVKRNFIASGIQVENGYKPLHLRYDFAKYPKDDLKYTMQVWRYIYSLPTRPSLYNYLT